MPTLCAVLWRRTRAGRPERGGARTSTTIVGHRLLGAKRDGIRVLRPSPARVARVILKVEDVVTALTVLVFALIGLRLVALLLQLLVARPPKPPVPPAAFDPCLGPLGMRRPSPNSPEGELALGLTSGAIDRRRYQQGMAGLAAADVRAHPLVAPPDQPGA